MQSSSLRRAIIGERSTLAERIVEKGPHSRKTMGRTKGSGPSYSFDVNIIIRTLADLVIKWKNTNASNADLDVSVSSIFWCQRVQALYACVFYLSVRADTDII